MIPINIKNLISVLTCFAFFVMYVGNVYTSSGGIIKKLMDFYTTLIICLMSSSSCMMTWFCFLEEICVVVHSHLFYLFAAVLVTELL